jgi:MoaA/NifB/PqqE/SkfB family radical SAM enzyme
MCYYRNAGFAHLEFVPNESIPLEVGIALFDQMANLGVPSLELTGGGEPLCYPKITECLDRIAKRDLELALVTNGSLLTRPVLDRIVDPKWIRFSIDSATPRTHEMIHRVPNQFGTVIKHLEQVVERGFGDCEVGVSFIIQPENYHEIVKATELSKSMGVDNIRFSYAYTSKYDELLTKDQRRSVSVLLAEAKKLETDGFKVFVMESRLDDFAPRNKKSFHYCGYQMFTLQIGCDNLVYPCCLVKYVKRYAFGDIRKQGLQEIIFGQERRKYIDAFNVDDCPPCWLKHKNEFIEYLLIQDAPHVNFI